LVNLWYGRKKKLQGVSIGQVWKPAPLPGSAPTSTAVTTPKA
jgi:preprotein translocase subunit SecD